MTTNPAPQLGRNAAHWRQTLSRVTANWHFKRRVTTPDGGFDLYVSPGSALSVMDPRGVAVDPVHVRFISRWVEPTSVVWDIGGNQGLFGFPAALKASRGQVYIFEPDVQLGYYLIRSMRRDANAKLPIQLMPMALSDSDGVAEFLISALGKSMNKLAGAAPWHDGLYIASEKRAVATLRIDSIAKTLRAPDIIKIDVEGAELRVLEGGRQTIAAARPIMLIESPKEISAGIKAFLDSLDYVIADGAAETPALIAEPVWDTVAIPKEKWRA